jgi:predicted restriction endonuclease
MVARRRKRAKSPTARILDKRYGPWRKAVLARDKHRCRFPGCKARTRLEIHHIYRWADAVELRYSVDNAICLCKTHHKLVTRSEHLYAAIFIEIVRNYK